MAVHLLWMTPDPLGAIAAMSGIYAGKVFRSLSQVSDEDRRHYWEQVQKTHLRAPLEAVKLHFLIEGVDRSFTHQLVRQRTAVYAQESLRFAVKEDSASEALMPPHIHRLPEDDPHRAIWQQAIDYAGKAYESLVNSGVPAEDARSVLPHATTTRIHYITDLRGLTEHAGNRLCTQAQFIWRAVFAKIIQCIRKYGAQATAEVGSSYLFKNYSWQFETIANSRLFRPVCYELNRCPFQASFDRPCSIRDRVEQFAANGVPSKEWENDRVKIAEHPEYLEGDTYVPGIKPEEWLLNPDAAR